MSDDAEKHILDEVNKSGHPVSINSSIILNKAGWYVQNSVIYSENNKEIDIVASKDSDIAKSAGFKVHNHLIIECKRSKKPWIFFKQNKISTNVCDLNIVAPPGVKSYAWCEKALPNHFYYKHPLCSYYFVIDTKPESKESKQIYHATQQVLSALSHIATRDENLLKKVPFKEINFYYPTIIFDGNLYSAFVEGDKTEVKEENYLQLYLKLSSSDFLRVPLSDGKDKIMRYKGVTISIVKKSFLKEFLEFFN